MTERRERAMKVRDAVLEIMGASLEASNLDELYGAIHRVITRLFQVDNFYIALHDRSTGTISFPYFIDSRSMEAESRPFGHGMTELVIRRGKTVFVDREQMHDLMEQGEMELIGELAAWWIGVPLRARGSIFGVLTIQSYEPEYTLDGEDVRDLKLLASASSMAIEKRRSEESLLRSERLYRTLVEKAKDGIVVVVDGIIRLANQQVCRMLEEDMENVVGQPYREFIAPSSQDMVENRYRRRLAGEDVRSIYEVDLIRSDGTTIPGELNSTALDLDEGRGVLVFVRDLTERRRAEERKRQLERRLQHSQRLESLGVLAGGVAHDFNNLLMGVLGNAGLALKELEPDHRARETIERLEKAALRAAELTNQLLAYSGKGSFVKETVRLNSMVEEMIDLLQSAVSSKVVIRTEPEEGIPPVRADTAQLRQVLMNLIMNASEAIGERSGVVTIRTGLIHVDGDYLSDTYVGEEVEEGYYTFVEVSDTGDGMDEETMARIFDPFFSTKFAGRGLGLASVLGITRGHGGTVKVYSEPGRGSSFKVLLPAKTDAAEPEVPGPEAEDAHPSRSGGTLLVVDDEESVRTVARLILEKAGYDVLTACDGREAEEVYREQTGRIRLVLLDMTMPHRDGAETYSRLRRIDPGVKVILTSGYSESDATARFSGKGLAGFIQKPYTPGELVGLVREALESR
jgi:PAS domain S-box-containing protein